MFSQVNRILQLPELKAKIVITLLLLAVCRLGSFVSVPGINGEIAANYFLYIKGGSSNLFQMFDIR